LTDTAHFPVENRHSRTARGLFALIEGALLLFVTGALLTAHADDPSLFTGSTDPVAHNLFGPAGSTIADLLFTLLGLAAYLIPVVLSIHLTCRLLSLPLPFSFPAGASLIMAGLPPLLASLTGKELLIPYPAGGLVGSTLSQDILPVANRAGTILLFSTMVLGGFMLVVHRLPLRFLSFRPPGFPVFFRRFPFIGSSWKREEEEAQNPSASSSSEAKLPPPGQLFLHSGTERGDPSELPEASSQLPRKQAKPPLLLDIPSNATTPPTTLLDPVPVESVDTGDFVRDTQKTLAEFFRIYQVSGKMAGAQTGPVITLFEFSPSPGLKVNRVTGLSNELALTLKVPQVRIQVPVPDKSTIGIEVPNPRRAPVSFREIYESLSFRAIPSPLSLAIGKSVAGEPYASDLGRMPHLLVAGATGTGKSVCLNALISSLLMKNGPQDVRLLMIDPKRLEMAPYEGIPHLIGPVVTEPMMAVTRLKALVAEMLRRYDLMKDEGVKNISEFRKVVPPDKAFPYIVVVIDELADLMLSQKKEVEPPIIRLAQMARAAGIHLVLATQRPSAQVVTGLIKTNIPTKIAFQVSSQIDSRVILDTGGAEFLLGAGDMLIKPPGSDVVRRLHGAYISEEEVHRIVEFWRRMPSPVFPQEDLLLSSATNGGTDPSGNPYDGTDPEEEGLYQEALAVVIRQKKASTSLIQRHLRIGYNRAARLIDRMESEGVIGPSDGTSRPRSVLKGFDARD
jgi:S-DNA-T family DNA segregation ATPase FtsK/SpoIIIE